MQALILAAGMGKRLKPLTTGNTKCMVEVNGVALIERMLMQLDEMNLSRVVLVIGYKGEKVVEFVNRLPLKTPIEFIMNPIYDKTNNIYSLSLAKDVLLNEDTLLLESDLIFEEGLLRVLVEDPRPTLALVDKYESWMDGTVVKLDENDEVAAFIPGNRLAFDDVSQYYKTVNVYKFSREFSRTRYVPFLAAYTQALGNNEYYEQVLRVITILDNAGIQAKRLSGQPWYEIDDLQDLDIAESMFANSGEERLALLQGRCGGLWRYPRLFDFCHLANPYYPSQRIMDEMKASFEKLLTHYPSGMRVTTLLAAKNLGIDQELIVVGNGATELIAKLSETFGGVVGLAGLPCEEHPSFHELDKSLVYRPCNPDYSYTADDLMEYFENRDIKALMIGNPGNPSGNYLPRGDVERLAAWCEARGVRLAYDETFIDFADEAHSSFFDEKALNRFPHMVAIKSISKSHGVPGARLGVLASADRALVATLKRKLSMWNINSFGEFYLQIAEKYARDYVEGSKKLRASRKRFVCALSQHHRLRVIPSQANYLLVEVLGSASAADLTVRLLSERSILVKHLSVKSGLDSRDYLRIAVRDDADNAVLIEALSELLD